MNNQAWFPQHPHGIALLASVAWALMRDFTAGNTELVQFLMITTLAYWGILSFVACIILLLKDSFTKSVAPRKDPRIQQNGTVKLPINGKDDGSRGRMLMVAIATGVSILVVYIREGVWFCVLIPAIGALLYMLLKRSRK